MERQSIQTGLSIFIEEFPELSTAILRMCPNFLHLVTSAVLATDVANSSIQQSIQDRFERVVKGGASYDVSELEKTQSVIEQILLIADVGHCAQSYDNFLKWNECFFYECLKNFKKGHGFDPREGWYKGQIGFLEGYILPLTERCSALVPQCELSQGTKHILHLWKQNGEDFTKNLVEKSIREDKVEEQAKLQEEKDYQEFLSFLASPPKSSSTAVNGTDKEELNGLNNIGRYCPISRNKSDLSEVAGN